MYLHACWHCSCVSATSFNGNGACEDACPTSRRSCDTSAFGVLDCVRREGGGVIGRSRLLGVDVRFAFGGLVLGGMMEVAFSADSLRRLEGGSMPSVSGSEDM